MTLPQQVDYPDLKLYYTFYEFGILLSLEDMDHAPQKLDSILFL
jgi:hypothetical protein